MTLAEMMWRAAEGFWAMERADQEFRRQQLRSVGGTEDLCYCSFGRPGHPGTPDFRSTSEETP